MAGLARILLATDLEPKSDRAMERAVRLARQFGAELTALHVFGAADTPYSHMPLHLVEADMRRHIAAVPGGAGIRSSAVAVRGAAVGQRVAGYASLWRPDLVVAGLHQPDQVADLFLSSTVERIAVADGTPLLVVRDKPLGPYSRALVPVDFSERSRDSVEAARALVPDGSLDLLHVVDLPGLGGAAGPVPDVSDFAAEFRAALGTAQEVSADEGPAIGMPAIGMMVRTGAPGPCIAELARRGGYDLVVLGSARRGALSRAFFGSVACDLLDRLPCDTLIAGSPPSPAADPDRGVDPPHAADRIGDRNGHL